MMYKTLLIALILTVALAKFAPKSQHHASYKAWKAKYSVSFSESQDRYRMFLFKQKESEIKAHNKNKANTYKQGHNKFSCLTQQEFESLYLGALPPKIEELYLKEQTQVKDSNSDQSETGVSEETESPTSEDDGSNSDDSVAPTKTTDHPNPRNKHQHKQHKKQVKKHFSKVGTPIVTNKKVEVETDSDSNSDSAESEVTSDGSSASQSEEVTTKKKNQHKKQVKKQFSKVGTPIVTNKKAETDTESNSNSDSAESLTTNSADSASSDSADSASSDSADSASSDSAVTTKQHQNKKQVKKHFSKVGTPIVTNKKVEVKTDSDSNSDSASSDSASSDSTVTTKKTNKVAKKEKVGSQLNVETDTEDDTESQDSTSEDTVETITKKGNKVTIQRKKVTVESDTEDETESSDSDQSDTEEPAPTQKKNQVKNQKKTQAETDTEDETESSDSDESDTEEPAPTQKKNNRATVQQKTTVNNKKTKALPKKVEVADSSSDDESNSPTSDSSSAQSVTASVLNKKTTTKKVTQQKIEANTPNSDSSDSDSANSDSVDAVLKKKVASVHKKKVSLPKSKKLTKQRTVADDQNTDSSEESTPNVKETTVKRRVQHPRKTRSTSGGKRLLVDAIKPANRDHPDWRAVGGVTAVRDQGSCGSCWAFSALGAVESSRLINLGIEQDLSEQQLVNCVYENRTNYQSGCYGGWMSTVYDYILHNNRGVEVESAVPYDGNYVACSSHGGPIKIKSYVESSRNNCASMKDLLVQGPISVALCASSLQNYRSNVFSSSRYCGRTCSVNHAVLAVGYTREGHWIMKNSWGTDWGLEGYFYLHKGNECRVCDYGGELVIPVPV